MAGSGQHYQVNAESCYHRKLYPAIRFYKAMAMPLALSDGKVCRVAAMTAEEFLDAIEVLLRGVSSTMRLHIRGWLYDLDYGDVVEDVSYARWYALEEIARVGVKLPSEVA